MEVIIQPTTDKAALLVARLIARRLRAKPALVLGLATGRTMEQVYDYLADMHRRENLDFSLCRTFNLDEYVGLAPNDPHSYRYYMDKHLFSRVNIDKRNTHLPNGAARDLAAECRHYEDLIHDCGGIDLQLLGIGADGHIGFNEPLSALRSRTREKALTPATIRQNSALFRGGEGAVPRRALTMGVGTILDASHVLTLVTGAEKAAILSKAVEGPITSMVTASALQLHPDCRVIVDEAAAKRLRGRAYYRWIFQNEPEWQEFRNR
ncbi:MAG: glucosamine-6-phosphate deaminase [Verrucomicrobia bacterium]|nr:glucosamine-6-phosphate deaminase [Verrucomicrobiota bacterium]